MPGRFAVLACSVALALAAGGCSFSYQMDNLTAKRDEGKPDQTASLLQFARPKSDPDALAQADWVLARAAVAEVLNTGDKDASAPWENPVTGARGTVTPLASRYPRAGTTCRDFLASYVKNGNESWLEGSACRAAGGNWEVRDLRPWKKT
jgi:surface antigen